MTHTLHTALLPETPEMVPAAIAARSWWRQSLAHGAPGIALVHVERAAAGRASWGPARRWLRYVTTGPVTCGPSSHPFYGAPALGHVLACGAGHAPGSPWASVLERVDHEVAGEAARRAAAGHARIDAGWLPAMAEFDAIRGLAGLGGYLLRRDPAGQPLRTVLAYLSRLTSPLPWRDTVVPGWWTATSPDGHPSARFPGGHGNLGVAHGICGPLALLAACARARIIVPGQHQAISAICTWLDQHRQRKDGTVSYPYWVTSPADDQQQLRPAGRQRLAWCYGTAGTARAIQLAGLATGNLARQHDAEDVLISNLTSVTALALTTTPSVCHGTAGLARLATAAARDAAGTRSIRLADAAAHLIDLTITGQDSTGFRGDRGTAAGFLDGTAGTALTLESATTAGPTTGWDTCLLTT